MSCDLWENSEADQRANAGRLLTHSLDSTEEGLAVHATRTCSITGCDRPHTARGLCARHYTHFRTAGELHRFPSERAQIGPCAIADCANRGNHRGLCWKHRQRVTRHGDPHRVLSGEASPRYIGDTAGYRTVHKRLGTVTPQVCVDCGRPATEWSYKSAAPDEQLDERTGLRFTVDLSFYEPRCRPCHRVFDGSR